MKLEFTWFNIIKIVKRSSHTFDMNDDVTIPMIELKIKNSKQCGYLPTQYRKAYLHTYRKFTRKL